MKIFFLIFLIFSQLCYSQFSSKNDTIILLTKKQVDTRRYLSSFATIPERRVNCSKYVFPTSFKGIPDSLNNIMVFIQVIDFGQAFYQTLKSGRNDDREYIDAIIQKYDTIGFHNKYINTYISVLTGLGKDSMLYYIPETNNNYDFSDETAYILQRGRILDGTNRKIHKIMFERFIENKVGLDSAFVSFGISLDDMVRVTKKIKKLAIHINESRCDTFRYNKIKYNLILTASNGSSAFYGKRSMFYFYTDSIDFTSLQLPYLKLNEYVELDGISYLIRDVLDNGEKVILVKGEMPKWRNEIMKLN